MRWTITRVTAIVVFLLGGAAFAGSLFGRDKDAPPEAPPPAAEAAAPAPPPVEAPAMFADGLPVALQATPASGTRALAYLMQPIGQVYLALKPRSDHPAILLNPVGEGRGILLTGTFGESYNSFGFLEYESILDGLLRRLPDSRPQILTNVPSSVQMEL